jgi:hypothetical protein
MYSYNNNKHNIIILGDSIQHVEILSCGFSFQILRSLFSLIRLLRVQARVNFQLFLKQLHYMSGVLLSGSVPTCVGSSLRLVCQRAMVDESPSRTLGVLEIGECRKCSPSLSSMKRPSSSSVRDNVRVVEARTQANTMAATIRLRTSGPSRKDIIIGSSSSSRPTILNTNVPKVVQRKPAASPSSASIGSRRQASSVSPSDASHPAMRAGPLPIYQAFSWPERFVDTARRLCADAGAMAGKA